MGKRGPKAGVKYGKRVMTAAPIAVLSDRELVAAQHFNDHLDRFLETVEAKNYPVPAVESAVVEQLIHAAEAMQEAIIGGIEAYSTSASPGEEGEEEDEVPPGPQ